MRVQAKTKYIRVSPYKLRPIINEIRGISVEKAINRLQNYALKRVRPVIKTINSAYANSINANRESSAKTMADFVIKEIRVDQGPIIRYYRPGAMGRASIQRKRLSHLEVILQEIKEKNEEK
ncbi:50S ribosomal protein L22 [Candidatus Dependentiae bacterium]|nr:50S ribosomal protein L22 [Candidatus Dependentiae bacterium]